MKAILTIGGESYLIPKTTDLNKILDLFQGVTRVRGENLWGPDDARYTDGFSISREVLDVQQSKIRVELVLDEDVCSAGEWQLLKDDHEKRVAEFKAKKSAAVS